MENDTITILIITAAVLFLWVPAIIFSVRKVLRKSKKHHIKENTDAPLKDFWKTNSN